MPLDPKQKQEMKDALEERRTNLIQELKNQSASAKPVSLDESIGRLSRMDAIQHQQIAANAKLEKENLLHAVKAALTRIDTEDFGHCVECGDSIEAKRLQNRPESVFCMECQRERE